MTSKCSGPQTWNLNLAVFGYVLIHSEPQLMRSESLRISKYPDKRIIDIGTAICHSVYIHVSVGRNYRQERGTSGLTMFGQTRFRCMYDTDISICQRHFTLLLHNITWFHISNFLSFQRFDLASKWRLICKGLSTQSLLPADFGHLLIFTMCVDLSLGKPAT